MSVLDDIRQRGGYVLEGEIQKLANNPTTRMTRLLVRCGCGRFVAPAQDAEHFIKLIERDDGDYVRDVSVM